MEFETRAIHDGQEPDPSTGAILTPIYATSTYVQDEVGKHKGYEYSRTGNPTRTALQECLASLENAKRGTGGFRLGCTSVSKGTDVRLIARKGDVAQVDFCTIEGCLRRWVLTSVLGPNGI